MKSQEIDILKLYSGQIKGLEDNHAWNRWLADCKKYEKINDLVHVRTGIQMGMAACEKRKMSNESIVNTFCRWIGSIDKTIRAIVKNKQDLSMNYEAKKQRDKELEIFLRKSSY